MSFSKSATLSFFNSPESLPLVDIKTIAGESVDRFLVVAPHPDDETLGCGGAIALLRQLNISVKVIVVSDGTQSHPNSLTYPSPALQKLREQESLAALNVLGVPSGDVIFLGMPDGAVMGYKENTVASIQKYLKELAPSIIFLPWRKDPHPDHRASWKIFTEASRNLNTRLVEYPIWDWDKKQRGDFAHSIKAWRLDISSVLNLKEKAIACYRSQIGDLIKDDPQGFRLTPQMLQNFTQPWEIYLEVKS